MFDKYGDGKVNKDELLSVYGEAPARLRLLRDMTVKGDDDVISNLRLRLRSALHHRLRRSRAILQRRLQGIETTLAVEYEVKVVSEAKAKEVATALGAGGGDTAAVEKSITKSLEEG